MSDYIKTVQTRLTRKGTRLSKSQIRPVYEEIVGNGAPTEEEMQRVVAQLESQFKPSQEPTPTPEPSQIVVQPQEDMTIPESPSDMPVEPSNSALTKSVAPAITQVSSGQLAVTQAEIQEAIEQEFGRENNQIKAAILNQVAQETFTSAQELQAALLKLRQMQLDIIRKVIDDHNEQTANSKTLLENSLITGGNNRRQESVVFFDSLEAQMTWMRAQFGI